MKKIKLISGLTLILFCVTILVIGVFAAQPASSTVSGTITVVGANPEIDVNVYQVSDNVLTQIDSGSSRLGNLSLSYGTLNFDTTSADTPYEAGFKEIRVKITNHSTNHDMGVYFWNQEDTNGLHSGESGFVSNTAPAKAKIGTKVVSSQTVEATDILYGHHQYDLGSLSDAVDFEYEFYNHLPKATISDSVVTPSYVYLTIFVSLLKLSDVASNVNVPVYLNIEEYEADTVTTDPAKGGIVSNSGFLRLPVVDAQTTCPMFCGQQSSTLYGNTNVTHIVVPANISTVPSSCFRICTKLKTVAIPDTATISGQTTFYGDSNLISVVLPTSTSVVPGQFYNCSSLATINIFGSSGTIGAQAFRGCTSLYTVWIFGIATFGDGPFYGCSALKHVGLPTGLSSLPQRTFQLCSNLLTINIPNSVSSIGQYCFARCQALKKVVLSNTLTTIYDYAFLGCTSILRISVPSATTSIGEGAFYECSSLTQVDLNSSSSITFGNITFYLTNLQGVFHISKNWTFSGDSNGQFIGTGITGFTLDSDDTRYMLYNNDGCVYKRKSTDSSNPNYNVPSYLEFYPQGNNASTYVIPSSVTGMRRYELANALNIGAFEVESGNTQYKAINGILYDISTEYLSAIISPEAGSVNLTIGGTGDEAIYNIGGIGTSITGYGFGSVILTQLTVNNPSSVHIIATCAFQDSSSLLRINSNTDGVFDLSGFTSLEQVGKKAFQNCNSLTTLKCPASLTKLGDGFVSNATNLEHLYLYNTSSVVILEQGQYVSTYKDNFVKSNITIHVPSTKLSEYKSSTYWSALSDRIVGDL